MPLDPDDPRPPYVQVANALRAAILTRKFTPGDKLPSRNELAKTYNVAPMTVQSAIRELRDEGLIVSRQGSGVFVRERTERPIGLRPHIERAFEAQDVTIDFAGFSGETLHGVITEPLDKIRIGRLRPESITVRLLVPAPRQPWSLPCTVEERADSPAFRKRAEE
ncbi:GntR family transcriptional regulator, partial [Amycolatopsis sp. NPDC059021]|uniref:GntR family transcriptional regulator n=1 Tax=Amycolatopsis sp. NPDC059021 TaxID=3346704 RepID=UPI00366ACE28